MFFCRRGLRPSGRAGRATGWGGGRLAGRARQRSDAILLAVKPAALETAAAQLGGRGRRDRLGARRAPRSRGCVSFSRRAGRADDADDRRRRSSRGVICHAPLEPRRRRDGRAAAEPVRRARPPRRGPGRADGRGDGGDGLLAGVPGARGPEHRRGRCGRGPRRRSWPTSSWSRRSPGTIELLRQLRPDRGPRAVASPRRRHGGGARGARRRRRRRRFQAAVRASLERMRGDDPRRDHPRATSPTTSRRCSSSTSS